MTRANQRTKNRPGKVVVEMPEGWAQHPRITNCITPTQGPHAGVPIHRDSILAEVLGWPHECQYTMTVMGGRGQMVTYQEKRYEVYYAWTDYNPPYARKYLIVDELKRKHEVLASDCKD